MTHRESDSNTPDKPSMTLTLYLTEWEMIMEALDMFAIDGQYRVHQSKANPLATYDFISDALRTEVKE